MPKLRITRAKKKTIEGEVKEWKIVAALYRRKEEEEREKKKQHIKQYMILKEREWKWMILLNALTSLRTQGVSLSRIGSSRNRGRDKAADDS